MPLKSQLLKGDQKLEACLVSDPAHIVPGARGEHVGKIQKVLVTLGTGVISVNEIVSMTYGPTTARAVLAFKGPPRNIINRAYQRTPDNIVGKITIEALDREFFDFENQSPPSPASIFVSLTPDGFPHDHSTCPFETKKNLRRVDHLATPINPLNFGRKINIGGEGETKYLGFEDFVTDFNVVGGPPRPMTDIIPDSRASDICIRSSPITLRGEVQIRRIAMSFCRLTVATNSTFLPSMLPIVQRLGAIFERISLKDKKQADGLGFQILVAVMPAKP
jgi:hypothetical protein